MSDFEASNKVIACSMIPLVTDRRIMSPIGSRPNILLGMINTSWCGVTFEDRCAVSKGTCGSVDFEWNDLRTNAAKKGNFDIAR
jgi:hypothetical protein